MSTCGGERQIDVFYFNGMRRGMIHKEIHVENVIESNPHIYLDKQNVFIASFLVVSPIYRRTFALMAPI